MQTCASVPCRTFSLSVRVAMFRFTEWISWVGQAAFAGEVNEYYGAGSSWSEPTCDSDPSVLPCIKYYEEKAVYSHQF